MSTSKYCYVLLDRRNKLLLHDHKLPFFWNRKVTISFMGKFNCHIKRLELNKIYELLTQEIDLKVLEESEKNLQFLKEMRLHAKKAFDNRDVASIEMLFKMIDDWIDELTQENE